MILDEDEWPGRADGQKYQRNDEVLHIELRRWAELFIVAPLDANTLAKLVNGLSDNCLTCVWRAWDPERPVVLAPAMNTPALGRLRIRAWRCPRSTTCQSACGSPCVLATLDSRPAKHDRAHDHDH